MLTFVRTIFQSNKPFVLLHFYKLNEHCFNNRYHYRAAEWGNFTSPKKQASAYVYGILRQLPQCCFCHGCHVN